MVAIEKALAGKLQLEEQTQQLFTIEEKLIKQNEAIAEQINVVNDSLLFPDVYMKALENIKATAEKSLSNYATIENQKEKLMYGENLSPCMNSFSMLTTAISELPKEVEEIEAMYQDAIWNPFMAVVMNEEIKKHLNKAYHNVLIPYFLEKTTEQLSCENSETLIYQIEETNKRMRVLIDKDTKKLERKLRREKDPEMVLKLLSVQHNKMSK